MTGTTFLSVDECDRLLTQPGSPFETQLKVIDGVKHRVWVKGHKTFYSLITERMQQNANRIFLSTPIAEPEPFHARESLTFGQVYERSKQLAAQLRERKVGLGTRVAIGGTNCTGWVVAFIAIHILGGCPVLLNNGLHIDGQVHCLALTQPVLVLVDNETAAQLAPRAEELRSKGVGEIWCWTSTAHLGGDVRKNITEMATIPRPKAEFKLGEINGLTPESDGIIFFTSGTTSLPKGVLVTQRQALHIVVTAPYPLARYALRSGASPEEAIALSQEPRPDGVALLSIPLFHVQGCLSWLVMAIEQGSKLVFLRRWSVPDAIKIMVEEKVGKIGGVPAICTAILQSPLLPKDFELQTTAFGGAQPPDRLPRDLVARWPNLLPATGWGMTETNGFFTGFCGTEYINKPLACGATVPIGQIRVVDPATRKTLPPGEVGLLLCKSSSNMKCYVNNPKATAETLDKDGWLDTGDLALIDKDGDLHITDRAKDIIIRGGENITAAEVERALALDDRVAQASAVPVPDAILGERVGCAVSLAPGASATPESIAETVWPRLRYPARPDVVVIMDRLPWNASQKVDKKVVKAAVLREWERRGRKPMVDRKMARL